MTAAEKEYGGALFSLACEEHIEDEVLAGLAAVKAAFAETPAYPKLLENPAVKQDERLALLDEAFRGSVHGYVLNFLKILCEKRALGSVAGCEAEYRAQLYAARGLLPVVASTAVPLTAVQTEALRAKLAHLTGKTVLLENSVDVALVGGVKLRYEGRELDGTVAGRLAALRKTLMA